MLKVYTQIDRQMDNRQKLPRTFSSGKQNIIGWHVKFIDIPCIQGRHLINNVLCDTHFMSEN